MVKTILLLDDNTATNFIHKRIISKSNYDIDVIDFEMGSEAIAYLSNSSNIFPELIFVDLNMPTMSAWEFLTALRKIERKENENTKCIVLTSSLSPEDTKMSENYPEIADIIIKPLDFNTLDLVMCKFF